MDKTRFYHAGQLCGRLDHMFAVELPANVKIRPWLDQHLDLVDHFCGIFSRNPNISPLWFWNNILTEWIGEISVIKNISGGGLKISCPSRRRSSNIS